MSKKDAKKDAWAISLKGIGPFSVPFSCQLPMSKCRAAVYAGNGIGKTTISRAFRIVELDGGVRKVDSLISKGESGGDFSFQTIARDGGQAGLEVGLRRESAPKISNSTDYLFHVFNRDYVDENLAAMDYQPSGNIDGYIVGKAEIDLEVEKRRLDGLKKKGVNLRAKLEQAIAATKNGLKANGVSANTSEYKSLTYEALLDTTPRSDDYEQVLAELRLLTEIPEGVNVPPRLSTYYTELDLDGLVALLTGSFSKANLAEEFLDEVRKKLSFVEMGMGLQKGDECPFCGQPYNGSAHKLIADYDRYLHDQEKSVIDRIGRYENEVSALADNRNAAVYTYLQNEKFFNKYKGGFSELASVAFDELASSEVIGSCVDGVLEALDQKRADVTKPIDCRQVAVLRGLLNGDVKSFEDANSDVMLLGKKLDTLSKEKTSLRKRLCVSAQNRCRVDCDDLVCEILETRAEYREQQARVTEKEASGKRSKRDAVADLFEKLLSQVFGDKYSFESTSFSIKLGADELGSEAGMILSEGEKSLVAFCYYVASTYMLLGNEADADRLLFVIDDPISSMDYHHVYEVAQIIRSLGDYLGSGGNARSRFLLLTHNAAFFNLLAETKIATDLFLMNESGIFPCDRRVIAPYIEHLADLKRVGDGEPPTHTTGNSIRQVLESLMHFEEPAADNLRVYLNEPAQDDLKKVEYIYTLCNDCSHGAALFGQEQPIDPKVIQRACRAVVEHVESKYPGQLKALT